MDVEHSDPVHFLAAEFVGRAVVEVLEIEANLFDARGGGGRGGQKRGHGQNLTPRRIHNPALARSLRSTTWAYLTPYADPVVLAVLTLALVFVPIRTVRKALQEILLITPPELDAHVRTIMDRVIARHGFKTYTSYVAKVGRAQFIEIHIAVPTGMRLDNVATADAIRREIADAIGGEGPQRWLTIDFTADPRWL